MPDVSVCAGSVGRVVSDPWEQSVYRHAVGVDPAVAVPFMSGAFRSAVCLACSRAGAPALWRSEGFLSRFPGPGCVPQSAVSERGLFAPAHLCLQCARSERLSFVPKRIARLVARV